MAEKSIYFCKGKIMPYFCAAKKGETGSVAQQDRATAF